MSRTGAGAAIVNDDDDDDLYGFSAPRDFVALQTDGNDAGDVPGKLYSRSGMDALWGKGGPPGSSANAPRTSMSRRGGPSAGAEERPLTAVRAAGYSSAGRAAGRGGGYDGLGQQGRGAAQPLQKPDRSSPEDQSRDMEKKVNVLLEDSSVARAEGNIKAALDKAKEASRVERTLCKYREANGLAEQINPDLTYSVQLNLAIQYQANEMNQDALAAYSILVRNKQYALSGRLRVNMGNIYYAEKKYPAAIKMYRMALDQVPNTGKELRYKIIRNIGNAFVKLGQYQDAVQSYESIMEANSDVRTGFNLIVCYYALGDKEKMKKGFAKLVSTRVPGVAFEEEEEDGVLGPFDDVLHDDPMKRESRDRYRMATKYVLFASKLIGPIIEKDFVSGYDYIIDCLRSTPFQKVINELEISKATTFLRMKQYDKAIEQLKQFEKRDQSLACIAATNLSFLYFLEGDYKNADKYAEVSIQTDSYNAKALVNKGNIYYQKAEYEKARDFYMEAHSIDGECNEALFNLGLSLKKLGKFEQALSKFEKLKTALPNNADIWYHIGDLHEMMMNVPAAIDAFTRAHSIISTDPGILARLGNIYIKDEDDSNAYNYHMDSYRLYPVNMDVISWLGAYFVKNEIYEKAIPYFERASQIQTNEIKWQLMIASCYRRIGLYPQALETYKQINSRFPENIECLKFLIHLCTDMGMKEEMHEYVAQLKKAERAAEAKAQAAAQNDRKGRKKKSEQPPDTLDFETNGLLKKDEKSVEEQEPAPVPVDYKPVIMDVKDDIAKEKGGPSVKVKTNAGKGDEGWGDDLNDDLLPM